MQMLAVRAERIPPLERSPHDGENRFAEWISEHRDGHPGNRGIAPRNFDGESAEDEADAETAAIAEEDAVSEDVEREKAEARCSGKKCEERERDISGNKVNGSERERHHDGGAGGESIDAVD